MTASETMPELSGQTIRNGRYKLLNLLGSGTYGVVYRALDLHIPTSESDPSPVERAIKIVLKTDDVVLDKYLHRREGWFHKRVSEHQNVLTLHHTFECELYHYFVFDFCSGGDLYTHVLKNSEMWKSDALLKRVFLQIIDAVRWCHKSGVYHRDLKPDNILYNPEMSEAYVADFGLSTIRTMSEKNNCGTTCYMSPECFGSLDRPGSYSTARNDIWSLGVILVFMLCGTLPWDEATTDDASFGEFMMSGESYFEMYGLSQGARSILQSIFMLDPDSRTSLKKLRKAVIKLDTFFMSEAETQSSKQSIAKDYRRVGPSPSHWVQSVFLSTASLKNMKTESLRWCDGPSPQEDTSCSEPRHRVVAESFRLFWSVMEDYESDIEDNDCDSLQTASSCSSGEDSDEIVTPYTPAQDPDVQVPDLPGVHGVGSALVSTLLRTPESQKVAKRAPARGLVHELQTGIAI